MPVSIHDEVLLLLGVLGLNPRLVQHIDIWPNHANVTLYVTNDQGRKRMEAGEPVMKTITIPVET